MSYQLNPAIKQQREKLNRIITSLRKAKAGVIKLNTSLEKEQLRLDKLIAQDFISHHKKYIGKWVSAVGSTPGIWNHATLFIKPTEFQLFLESRTMTYRVLIRGIILCRYTPSRDHSPGWRLHGTLSNPGFAFVFGGVRDLVKMLRPASQKVLRKHRKLFSTAEEQARKMWGIGY